MGVRVAIGPLVDMTSTAINFYQMPRVATGAEFQARTELTTLHSAIPHSLTQAVQITLEQPWTLMKTVNVCIVKLSAY